MALTTLRRFNDGHLDLIEADASRNRRAVILQELQGLADRLLERLCVERLHMGENARLGLQKAEVGQEDTP